MHRTGAGPEEAVGRTRGAWPSNRAQDLEKLAKLAESRLAIEGVDPEIDGGRFAAKGVAGQPLLVAADVFGDGHDSIAAALLYRPADETEWREVPMVLDVNDRWQASFIPERPGNYVYSLIAWRDLFATWRKDTSKKFAAGQQISLELEEGRRLVEAALNQEAGIGPAHRRALKSALDRFGEAKDDAGRRQVLFDADLEAVMHTAGPRTSLTQYERTLRLFADRKAAAFSAWYELFPRSQSGDATRHGTLPTSSSACPMSATWGSTCSISRPSSRSARPIGKGGTIP